MTDGTGIALSADAAGRIVLALGSVEKQIQALRRDHAQREQAELARLRNYIPLTQTATVDASGNAVLDFGTPGLGRVWTGRLFMTSVQGSELTAPAGTVFAGWYIGNILPGSGVHVTMQWRETHNPLPAKTTYTSDIHQARMGEHLFVVVTGATAGQIIVCNAVVLDEPMKVGVPVLQG